MRVDRCGGGLDLVARAQHDAVREAAIETLVVIRVCSRRFSSSVGIQLLQLAAASFEPVLRMAMRST